MKLQRSLALSGPMGAGKSTVARAIAAKTGLDRVDIDEAIEARTGTSVGALFAEIGERAFRAMEREEVARALDGAPKVIALGGGAVVDPELRRSLVDRAIVVTLLAPADHLVARMGPEGVARRPLLASAPSPAIALENVLQMRAHAYRECHAQIDTARASVDDVADRALAVATRDPIAVPLGACSYVVEIGRGVVAQLSHLISRATSASACLVVSDRATWPFVSASVERALGAAVEPLLLEPGEVHKTIGAVESIWDRALDRGLTRAGCLVAIGGGVVGDLTGFAAATLLRGVRFLQVPTTLLAMVDASVGGKTAIDRAQGKNLVGAFHQPSGVLVDVDFLATLPLRDLRSGLAEIVKMALIGDAQLLDALEAHAEALARGDLDAVASVIRAPIAAKARVVADDEHETRGSRITLNFGHTVGHALEAHGGLSRWTHGEAVALGMVAALEIGVARGVTEPALLARVVRLLERLGLPSVLDREEVSAALPLVRSDKKRVGDRVTFVLVPSVGRTTLAPLTTDEIARSLRTSSAGAARRGV